MASANCFSQLLTLLRRNWLVKKRHPVSLLFEIALPVCFVLIFMALKSTEENVFVPWGWSSTSENVTDAGTGTPISLFEPGYTYAITYVPDYAMYSTEMSVPGLLFLLKQMGASEIDRPEGYVLADANMEIMQNCSSYMLGSAPAPSSDCRIVPYKLAVVGMDADYYQDYFKPALDSLYPETTLLDTSPPLRSPALSDMLMTFASAAEFDEYISSKSYGTTQDKPKVFAGIQLDRHPAAGQAGDWEYTIRMNTTRDMNAASVGTTQQSVDSVLKVVDSSNYRKYAQGGFLTLQTLLNKFIHCNPDPADPATCLTAAAVSSAADQARNASYEAYLDADPSFAALFYTFRIYTGRWDLSLQNITEEGREKLFGPLRVAPQPVLGASMWATPTQAFMYAPFYDIIKDNFPLALFLGFVYSVSRILSLLVQEKEQKYREALKMIGVSNITVINSWYITYGAVFFVTVVAMTAMSATQLFPASSGPVIFLFFFLFALDIIAFSFMISTFFSKAKVASIAGSVIFMVFFLLYYSIENSDIQYASKASLFFSAPAMFGLGVRVIANLEAVGIGVSLASLPTTIENWNMGSSFLFMILDFFLYTLVAHYLEQVLPQEWGVQKPWYFPFEKSFWKSIFWNSSVADFNTVQKHKSLLGKEVVPSEEQRSEVEPVSVELQQQETDGRALLIQSLRKVFDTPAGEKVAVDRLNLKMYEGQITCLLGHNGAGKTTTMSMLTGLLPPSDGDAFVGGLSIREHMTQIRKSLGVCPQHDILYPELTVEEHLKLFGSLKGLSGRELEEECAKKIAEVGLTEKVKVRSQGLSGGMKRKLSLAMAFLGDSKIVFLDEPTSGMDPYSRRSTWDMIQNNRDGRVIVLTTHFMDEADLLGDRIAIMAEGQLRCCGSSLFLKNKYGVGYNLTIIHPSQSHKKQIKSLIKGYVPESKVLSEVGAEIAFQLPIAASSQFPTMFTDLDEKKKELGIEEYGISVTTLEEVFIKVAEVGDAHDQELQKQLSKELSETRVIDDEDAVNLKKNMSGGKMEFKVAEVGDRNLFFTHFKALFQKRYRYAKRDKRSIICSILLPLLLLNIGLIILKTASALRDEPKLVLSLDDLGGSDAPTPYVCFESQGDDLCTSVMSESNLDTTPKQVEDFVSFDTESPFVFDLPYSDLPINSSKSLALSFSQYMFSSGYGYNDVPLEKDTQYAGYLLQTDADTNTFAYNMALNSSSTHGAAVFKWVMDQSLYRTLSGDASHKITVNSHPLPLTSLREARLNSFLSMSAVMFMLIAVAFIPASIVTYVVREREVAHNAKHQQLVSGVGLSAYWLANFCWDFLIYLVIYVITLVLIQLYDLTSLTGGNCTENCIENVYFSVAVLWLAYGVCVIPFTYLISNFFSTASTAQNLTLLINNITGLILMIVAYFLEILESTKDIVKVLNYFFRLFPGFCLGDGLMSVSVSEILATFGFQQEDRKGFDLDFTGWPIIYLFGTSVIYMSLTIAFDVVMSNAAVKNKVWKDKDLPDNDQEVDDDVAREIERVKSGKADDDVIRVVELRKVYGGKKQAVRNLTFGIPRGECFGFLGINGAGKTTTMKIMTGEIPPTSGGGSISGYDILTEQINVRRKIGYCPQFDALLDLLTVREHLELFAKIKGVPPELLEDTVMEMIRKMDLTKFENKLAHTLSGGNKRKLSVGIALLGAPPVVFLDEPSTGMDPVARRFMWEVIAKVSTRSKDSCVILTTHSMEECEALSSKVGIMVGGKMRCFGSIQHLKSRFGHGLMMSIRLDEVELDLSKEKAIQTFGDASAVVTEEEIPSACAKLGMKERSTNLLSGVGSGWTIHKVLQRDAKVNATVLCSWWIAEDRATALDLFMKRNFVDTELVERHDSLFRYQLSSKNLQLSKVFSTVEAKKKDLTIREYSVSQTSLEQVFNQFAAQQNEETAKPRGIATEDFVEVETPQKQDELRND